MFADTLFLILYKELYYRHVYARVQVSDITGPTCPLGWLTEYQLYAMLCKK